MLSETKPKPAEKVDPDLLTIGDRTIARGQRVKFDLPVVRLYTHTDLSIPIEIIRGRRPGPCVLCCAALHGDELNGVEIIRRLSLSISRTRISGTLILVPIINVFGFINKTRYMPDRRDLNRCFPGSEKGSIGGRFAHLFCREVVSKATHVLDFHTGAIHRSNLPQIRANLSEPLSVELAHSFDVPVIVDSGIIAGSLREYTNSLDIPAVTYEAGEALRFDERAIRAGLRGARGVLSALGMIRIRKHKPIEPFIAHSTSWVRANQDGVFRPQARLGQRVAKGETLGLIASPLGDDEMIVESPAFGVIIGRTNLPLVNEGDALFNLARFEAPSRTVAESVAEYEADVLSDPRLDEYDTT